MGKKLVSVIYLDGTVSEVSSEMLDVLIATGRIRKFKRENGWVDIENDSDRLRSFEEAGNYPGPERRAPWRRDDGATKA